MVGGECWPRRVEASSIGSMLVLQASLVASGLLGIYVFGEIQGKPPITFFFCSAFVVVFGAGAVSASRDDNRAH